jgi:uncharacterized protein YciI
MKYFLVLLSDQPEGGPETTVALAHERFIDSLIARNAVLLGGGFETPMSGFYAAYVLAADDIATARAVAQDDPLVRDAGVRCAVTEWRLVGIDPAAIDPSQIVSG